MSISDEKRRLMNDYASGIQFANKTVRIGRALELFG